MDAQVEAHRSLREALINTDRALRRDQPSLASFSDIERRADAYLRWLRHEEEEKLWNADHPDVVHPFPGMEFLTGKSIIHQSKLFDILCKMPKGALLHSHLDATVNAEVLLRLVLQHAEAYYVSVPQHLTEENLYTIPSLPKFCVKPLGECSNSETTLTHEYVPETWVPYALARKHFAFGGPEGFDKWVTAGMTIHPEEAYDTFNTSRKIWIKFISCFGVSGGLFLYEPVYKAYIREYIFSTIADGISYVEPRMNFFFKTMPAANGRDELAHRDWLIIFDRIIDEIKEELRAEGRQDEFIGARIIYSTVRSIEVEELEWYLEDCLALKREFPHLISGFDLVGEENAGKPLIDFIEPLLRFQNRQKEEGISCPFIFHAGETLGDGSHADLNLYDALLLGTKRIGHGFSLYKHPELMKMCRERGVAVEACPISNEILRLTTSIPCHPLPVLLNNGVPVALCSDDPGVFGNMGLSYDFYQVFVASEVNGLNTLAKLAQDSLEFSTLEGEHKFEAMEAWRRRWNEFTRYIVESVGVEEM